jgi:HEAT repeat protein
LKLRGLGEIQGVAKTDDTLAAIPAGVILEIASHEEGSQGRHIDADGRFAVDRVLPGEYEFSVLENPDGVVVRSVRCGGEAVTANAPLPLGDRQKVSDCEVVLGYEFSASAAAQPIETANSLVAQFNSVKNPWSQFDVAKKIVQLHDARALPELEPWLTSEDMQARGNAAFIFAKFGDDRGVQILREILEDRSTNTKRKVDAIDDAGQRSTELQIVYDRRRAIDLFGDLGDPRAAPLLIPLLNDNELNSDIPWALGKVGNKSAIPPLLALLSDKQADRRAEAIQALAELDAREALPQLRGMVDDDAKIYHDWIGTVGNAARVAIAKLEAPLQ